MWNIRSVRLAALAVSAGVIGVIAPRLAAGEPALGASGQAPAAVSPAAHRAHVVGRGETLWGLSRRYRPGEDPRRFVHEVGVLNELAGGTLLPGQRLVLPPPP